MVFAVSSFQKNLCSQLNSGDWFKLCSAFHSSEGEFLITFVNKGHKFQSNHQLFNGSELDNEEVIPILDSICDVLFEPRKFPFSYVTISPSKSDRDGCVKELMFHKFSSIVQSLSAVYVTVNLSIGRSARHVVKIRTRSISTCIIPCSIPLAPFLGVCLCWVPFPDFGANADYLHDVFQCCTANIKASKQLLSSEDDATVVWTAPPSCTRTITAWFSETLTAIPDSLKFFSFVILLPIACITYLLLLS